VAITQWILGIRPDFAGLRVEPVLPLEWPGYTATRRYRGATYEISVRKPAGAQVRGWQLHVDGQLCPGSLVPAAEPGSTVTVELTAR
jgi:cellobiose phosphorylase